MKKELICIGCPTGCAVTVEYEGKTVLGVTGNRCKNGYDYAVQEAIAPVRVLTGLMRAEGCERPFAVRTSRPVPKERIRDCARALKGVRPPLPVRIGDVVLPNVCGTGADVVAAQDFAGDE